ncbi:hypothetical protein AHAS_Ahas15G0302700 [Arachis hypogaea]
MEPPIKPFLRPFLTTHSAKAPPPTLLFFLVFLLVVATLQSKSKSGIICLNDQSLSRFLTSVATPRPYSIVIFFDAVQLHDKIELRLHKLHQEFSIVSSSFIANHNISHPWRSKLFFCDIKVQGISGDFSPLAESMADFVESKTKISVVGLLLAFISQGLVKMKNVTVQKLVMMFALLGCFLAVKQVVFLNNWKTSYGIHGFWTSS